MNRTIKFRGRALRDGTWVYGLPHSYGDGVFIGQTRLMNNEGRDWRIPAIEVDPTTIGQFTGILDSNGREIYEGDTLRCYIYYDANSPPLSSPEHDYADCLVQWGGDQYPAFTLKGYAEHCDTNSFSDLLCGETYERWEVVDTEENARDRPLMRYPACGRALRLGTRRDGRGG